MISAHAHQVAGVHADREQSVVWAVTKGSLKNKTILVPAALTISALITWAITPLLMIGGAYLCYEGFKKIAHNFLRDADQDPHHSEHLQELTNSTGDLLAIEKRENSGRNPHGLHPVR